MSWLKLRWDLSTKLLAMACSIILTFCLAIGWQYMNSRDRLYEERRQKVQHQVEAAYGVLEYFAGRAARGELTLEEAQFQAKTAVKNLRYGEDDYFWINDLQPAMIMHPMKPQLDGKDLAGVKDPTGKMLFNEFVEICKKQDEGFVDYYWPKPGFNEPVAKVSFVKLFPDWGWIIGNGLYVDDVDKALASVMYFALGVIALVIIITALLVYLVTCSIRKPLQKIFQALKELARGHTDIDLPTGRPKNCSSIKKCGQSDCRSYGQVDICWVNSGSYAVQAQCFRIKKGEDCRTCEVYGPRNEMEELGSAILGLASSMRSRASLALQIAEGDLTRSASVQSEKDTLGRALNQMLSNLKLIIHKIQDASLQIATGSSQVAETCASLTDGASQQASAMEEIAAAMNQMSTQTKQSAEHANQASRTATRINAAGKNISKITKVIEEIAFQTNLLALNAAVEAARAGVHGKGFAVVAEEVRNLAGRSAKAAKQAEELIYGAQKMAENGNQVDEQSVSAGIVGGIGYVTDLMGEIATASNEQAQGIDQINQSLMQIDDVTQQNVASTEETTSIADELVSQTIKLKELLGGFNLGDESVLNQQHASQTHYSASPGRWPAQTSSANFSGSGTKRKRSRSKALT